MSDRWHDTAFKIYGVSFDLLRIKKIQSIRQDDEALVQQRDQLTTEINRLKQNVDELQMEKMKSMMSQLQTGLNYVQRNDMTNAYRYFQTVEEYSKMAAALAITLKDKVIISRIRILAALVVGCYFFPDSQGQPCDLEALQTNCQAVFHKLIQLPIVMKAIKDEFEGRNLLSVAKRRMSSETPRNDRHVILNEINQINLFLYSIFGIKARFSVFKKQVTVDLHDCKPVELNVNNTPINKIWVFRKRIFTVQLEDTSTPSYAIKIWDALQFAYVGEYCWSLYMI